ncbi:hypothetical protein F4780DRAFT_194095 [Xylariomycetidae sp. FL0641]|nr:hypothetical protein F4780DRAFT_194095 [Xylariomycetidae sp. FL0641]
MANVPAHRARPRGPTSDRKRRTMAERLGRRKGHRNPALPRMSPSMAKRLAKHNKYRSSGPASAPPAPSVSPTTRKPTLLDLLSSSLYPVKQALLAQLEVKDRVILAQTSREINQALRPDVNARLSRYFEDPLQFRTLSGRCNALVFGGFVLQCLCTCSWPDDNLDIMVDDWDASIVLGQYLTDQESYIAVGKAPQSSLALSESLQCTRYENSNGAKIQLFTDRTVAIQALLKFSGTSATVNVMSWNKCYSLFPRTTFIYKETVPLQPIAEASTLIHSKLVELGWSFRVWLGHLDYEILAPKLYWAEFGAPINSFGNPVPQIRRIGDCRTWVQRLCTEGVARPSTPDEVLESARFSLRPANPDAQDLESVTTWAVYRETAGYRISSTIYRSPALHYQYVIEDSEQGRDRHTRFHLKAMNKIFNASTLQQLPKLSRTAQEGFLKGRLPRAMVMDSNCDWTFFRPRSWDYLDHMMWNHFRYARYVEVGYDDSDMEVRSEKRRRKAIVK